MKKFVFILLFLVVSTNTFWTQTKTIHVFVALCDNEHQGIVPVPSSIGNGKDIRNNLYWGAAYGMKSFLKLKTKDWIFIKSMESSHPNILECVLFKHASSDVYLLADAYDGEQIKRCIEDFLKTSNKQLPLEISHDNKKLDFGGNSDLVSYIGHNGLMDFDVEVKYNKTQGEKIDVIILACYSKLYFTKHLQQANANPLLWTTHLMAPEAYTIKAALDGWMQNEAGNQIDERAAQTYNKYQKCGIKGARNLFTTGF